MKYAKTRTYKYCLKKDFVIELKQFPFSGFDQVRSNYAYIRRMNHSNPKCILSVLEGYRWDGSSGPTIDTKNTMIPSLIHDVLYQLLRESKFPGLNKKQLSKVRKWADWEYYRALRREGMSYIRARVHYYALRVFGSSSANPKNRHVVKEVEV